MIMIMIMISIGDWAQGFGASEFPRCSYCLLASIFNPVPNPCAHLLPTAGTGFSTERPVKPPTVDEMLLKAKEDKAQLSPYPLRAS